jgi:drug/metabolite transporter (DMT)-like permease
MFYRALSIGTMGVVAPVAALGVAVPVVVGLARGEQPSAWQLLGIAVAVAGVVLASGPELSMRAGLQPLLLAVGAAVGFGVVLLLVARASEHASDAVVMTLVTMRATSVSVLLVVLAVVGRRARLGVGRRDLPLLMLTGACDAAANGTYALASRSSLLSVAAVLASLYPVVTALLAYRLLAERLRPVQWVGVAASLVGVGLLAGG